jgi:hypothetical protein
MAERDDLVDLPRLGANSATERIQPHHFNNKNRVPINPYGAVGVISTITRGPTGVGATYRQADASNAGWHTIEGPEPLVQRAVGA